MFEKVNPSHPDKVADRIAGAMVDFAYKEQENPKVAVEVLLGHGECNIIVESSVNFKEHKDEVQRIVNRIVGKQTKLNLVSVKQDSILAENQEFGLHCGDNGIFKGVPTNNEEKELSAIARAIYAEFGTDGKYILNDTTHELIICQSHATNEQIKNSTAIKTWEQKCKDNLWGYKLTINPLGEWTGGIEVDSGATNRKLGSDMGRCVTGGGLMGKDLSKADVSVNIYAYLKAQKLGAPVEFYCAIGQDRIDGKPYQEIVNIAKEYIKSIGGFEKFAEWGLI